MGKRIAVVLWLTFCHGLLAGIPNAQSKPAAQAPVHKRSSAPAAKSSDAEIESRIRAKLVKSKIGKNGFTVHVSGGVATWEGKTDVIQHKGAATRMAKTAGATSVINKIQISDAARAAAKAKLETGRRRVQVKRGEIRSSR